MEKENGFIAKYNRSKVSDWILNVLLFSVIFLVGLLCYWEIRDYEVLTPLENNYELSKEVYKKGEVLEIKFRICKNLNYPEQVLGRFVDGVIFSIPDKNTNFDVGCYDTYLTGVSIPETLPEGDYIYEEKIVYRVNPFKTIEYTFTTPPFAVVE
jgi:hypothetical protein